MNRCGRGGGGGAGDALIVDTLAGGAGAADTGSDSGSTGVGGGAV